MASVCTWLIWVSQRGGHYKGGQVIHPYVTEAYRPPELSDRPQISPAVDAWSLGCSIFESATGECLFKPEAGFRVRDRVRRFTGIARDGGCVDLKLYLTFCLKTKADSI